MRDLLLILELYPVALAAVLVLDRLCGWPLVAAFIPTPED